MWRALQNDLENRDEDKEEMSFDPSAPSDSAGWYEPKFMSDKAVQEGRFQVLRPRVDDGG